MSSYAIQAVSDPTTIIKSHQDRGFEVFTLDISWAGAQALAKSLGMPTDSKHLMVVSTMARKLHEASRSNLPMFTRPTLVVMPAPAVDGLQTIDWKRVCQAADEAESDVVFLHAPA